MLKELKGFFITFEGVDGVGKTTQIALLDEFIKKEQISCFYTREPGGTTTGEQVRNILLDPANDINSRAEVLLYLAARAEHVDKIIKPELEKNLLVVSDRFSDSTLVYQGVARGLNIEEIRKINSFATNGLEPDLTFLLDAPAELLVQRMHKRGLADRIEMEGLNFQQKVREGFLTLAQKYPKRIVTIDALENHQKIQEKIQQTIKERFLNFI